MVVELSLLLVVRRLASSCFVLLLSCRLCFRISGFGAQALYVLGGMRVKDFPTTLGGLRAGHLTGRKLTNQPHLEARETGQLINPCKGASALNP